MEGLRDGEIERQRDGETERAKKCLLCKGSHHLPSTITLVCSSYMVHSCPSNIAASPKVTKNIRAIEINRPMPLAMVPMMARLRLGVHSSSLRPSFSKTL